MIRGLLLLLGVALVAIAAIHSLSQLTVDGVSTLAILGFLIAFLANRRRPAPS